MRRMNLGQIVDYCIEWENQHQEAEGKPHRRKATTEDYEAFFG